MPSSQSQSLAYGHGTPWPLFPLVQNCQQRSDKLLQKQDRKPMFSTQNPVLARWPTGRSQLPWVIKTERSVASATSAGKTQRLSPDHKGGRSSKTCMLAEATEKRLHRLLKLNIWELNSSQLLPLPVFGIFINRVIIRKKSDSSLTPVFFTWHTV